MLEHQLEQRVSNKRIKLTIPEKTDKQYGFISTVAVNLNEDSDEMECVVCINYKRFTMSYGYLDEQLKQQNI